MAAGCRKLHHRVPRRSLKAHDRAQSNGLEPENLQARLE